MTLPLPRPAHTYPTPFHPLTERPRPMPTPLTITYLISTRTNTPQFRTIEIREIIRKWETTNFGWAEIVDIFGNRQIVCLG